MEDDHITQNLSVCRSLNLVTRGVFLGIATGCHDDAHGRFVCPFQFDLIEGSVHTRLKSRKKVALQTRQDNLCFGVAESAVEFQHLESVVSEHQTSVHDPGVGASFCLHPCYYGTDDLIHDLLVQFSRHHGCR